LIVTPQPLLPPGQVQKRIENRTWNCRYRGPLLIHAGKSKSWLKQEGWKESQSLTFGAIVGQCVVRDCFEMNREEWKAEFPWAIGHTHTEGPFCIVLDRVKRFVKPIPYSGKLGLFEVPDDVFKYEVLAFDD
jgi:hypothetical protein